MKKLYFISCDNIYYIVCLYDFYISNFLCFCLFFFQDFSKLGSMPGYNMDLANKLTFNCTVLVVDDESAANNIIQVAVNTTFNNEYQKNGYQGFSLYWTGLETPVLDLNANIQNTTQYYSSGYFILHIYPISIFYYMF
jgi:hypothetical protein